ncbi:hypothetical protein GXW71_32640 [Roseomonas hellenica]|uniref:PNPLA domain-containing protein n=1 Tax=Plastoroseomonas hellenica TaxID=2687306 RepID=A0ABS5F9A3_9PROT|nr:hypothetical protein [Plastoroseomonas hellenica]MBR0669144.1 hypothetical protein [Plastoroseomonas hellenica]
MPMVTENSAAQLGRALGSGTPVAPPPGPKRWPAWYFSLADALSAARAPVLAASAYFAVVALPDQSAEAARMMLDWHWFSLIVGVVLWGAFSAYLAITLAAMASRAFRIDSKARALAAPVVQKFLILLLLAAPFLAGFFALGGHHIIGSVVSPLLERETWTELLAQVAMERVLRQEAPVSMARAFFAFILDSNVFVFLYSLVEVAFRGFAILMLAIYFGLPTIVIAFVLLYGALAGLANALAWILSRLGIRARRLDPAWPVVEVFDHHFLDLHGEKLEGVAVTIGVLFLIWTIGWGVAEYLFGIYVEIPTLFFLPIWATALCAALIGLVWLSARWHVPVLVPCLVFASLWSCADISDNHDIRHRLVPQLAQAALPIPGGDGARPPGRAQVDADPRRPLTDTFRLWLDQRADMARWHQAGRPFPVLLVAAEGGGARAAYFTALVMEELRARCPRLLHHTFLMVGVSGGSLGSALVAASAQAAPPAPGPGCEPPGAAPAEARGAAADAARVLEADLLSPLVRGTLVSDLLARLIPWDWPYIFGGGWLRRSWNWAVREPFTDITDRSRYLERAVDRAWRDRTGRTLDQLSFEGVWEGTRGDVPAFGADHHARCDRQPARHRAGAPGGAGDAAHREQPGDDEPVQCRGRGAGAAAGVAGGARLAGARPDGDALGTGRTGAGGGAAGGAALAPGLRGGDRGAALRRYPRGGVRAVARLRADPARLVAVRRGPAGHAEPASRQTRQRAPRLRQPRRAWARAEPPGARHGPAPARTALTGRPDGLPSPAGPSTVRHAWCCTSRNARIVALNARIASLGSMVKVGRKPGPGVQPMMISSSPR